MLITCGKYVAGSGTRCAYYLDNGACVRPDELMCVEWLKRNAPSTRAHEARAHLRAIREQLAARTGGA